MLFGRNRPPLDDKVRAVMGIKGEPSTPDDSANGVVWQSIIKKIDMAGGKDAYTSSTDIPRSTLCRHPWSIGGGGAAELKELIGDTGTSTLGSLASMVSVS